MAVKPMSPLTEAVKAVGGGVGATVGAALGASVGASVGDPVGASVGVSVGETVGDAVGVAVLSVQVWLTWLALQPAVHTYSCWQSQRHSPALSFPST